MDFSAICQTVNTFYRLFNVKMTNHKGEGKAHMERYERQEKRRSVLHQITAYTEIHPRTYIFAGKVSPGKLIPSFDMPSRRKEAHFRVFSLEFFSHVLQQEFKIPIFQNDTYRMVHKPQILQTNSHDFSFSFTYLIFRCSDNYLRRNRHPIIKNTHTFCIVLT